MSPATPAAEVAPSPASAPATVADGDGPSIQWAEAPARSAPEKSPVNALFVEPLGNGLLYSVNYERIFFPWKVGVRVGASFITYKVSKSMGSGNLTLATFPLVASYYLGPLHHKLQLGLGATVLYFDASSDATGYKFEGAGTGLGVAATGVIGYRYLPKDGGFTFGAGFTPLLRAAKGFLPWGGVNAGFAF